MKVTAKPLTALTLLIFFGSIGVAELTGYWRTESSKIPATYTEGEFAGLPDPGDIRGSYTFGDVGSAFEISPEILGEAFGVGEPEAVQVKVLEELYADLESVEVGTDAVRLFVALYLGRPYEAEETTALPATAIPLIPEERREEARERAVAVAAMDAAAAEMESAPEEAEDSDGLVRGMTTVAEVISWGVPEEEVAVLFGGSVPEPRSLSLRDAAMAAGIEFSEIKERLQEAVDR